MDSRPLKILAALTAVAALLFGYLAVTTSREEASNERALPTEAAVPANWPTVVVAGAALEEGKAIDAAALKTVSMQVSPTDAFAKVEEVAGKTPMRAIAQGELITKDHFASRSELAGRLGEDERAVAMQLDEVISVGGLVQPGDYVDVVVYVQRDGHQIDRSQARIILEHIRVLAVSGREGSKRGTAVLAVPAPDVPRLVLASNAGNLRLALHGTTATAAETRLGTASMLPELGRPLTKPKASGEQIIVYRGGSSSRVVP